MSESRATGWHELVELMVISLGGTPSQPGLTRCNHCRLAISGAPCLNGTHKNRNASTGACEALCLVPCACAGGRCTAQSSTYQRTGLDFWRGRVGHWPQEKDSRWKTGKTLLQAVAHEAMQHEGYQARIRRYLFSQRPKHANEGIVANLARTATGINIQRGSLPAGITLEASRILEPLSGVPHAQFHLEFHMDANRRGHPVRIAPQTRNRAKQRMGEQLERLSSSRGVNGACAFNYLCPPVTPLGPEHYC
jgi:hypothetical protein